MVKFLLVSACLLAAAAVLTTSVSARKVPQSPLSLKYKNLNYFENDPDIQLQEDETDDNTPQFVGDNTKAKIFNSENIQRGKGKFKYSHNTENGISVQQAGKLKDNKTFVVQGSYSYTGADGRRYRVKYTADEFGYHPITELDVDLPDEEDTQNDIPDVAPFKVQLGGPRVQKATPKPIVEVVTLAPNKPVAPLLSQRFGDDGDDGDDGYHYDNPYGVPGPYVGNAYLPPNNEYLPPGGAPAPRQAEYSAQGDFLDAPTDYYTGAGSSSVFKYI